MPSEDKTPSLTERPLWETLCWTKMVLVWLAQSSFSNEIERHKTFWKGTKTSMKIEKRFWHGEYTHTHTQHIGSEIVMFSWSRTTASCLFKKRLGQTMHLFQSVNAFPYLLIYKNCEHICTYFMQLFIYLFKNDLYWDSWISEIQGILDSCGPPTYNV